MSQNYIYIVQTRESIRLNDNVYKIGMTRSGPNKRVASYGPKSRLILLVEVECAKTTEKVVLDELKKQFEQDRNYGLEYFKVNDLDKLKTIVFNICKDLVKEQPDKNVVDELLEIRVNNDNPIETLEEISNKQSYTSGYQLMREYHTKFLGTIKSEGLKDMPTNAYGEENFDYINNISLFKNILEYHAKSGYSMFLSILFNLAYFDSNIKINKTFKIDNLVNIDYFNKEILVLKVLPDKWEYDNTFIVYKTKIKQLLTWIKNKTDIVIPNGSTLEGKINDFLIERKPTITEFIDKFHKCEQAVFMNKLEEKRETAKLLNSK